MERRFDRNLSIEGRGGSVSLQKQLEENRRNRAENCPDLSDFMNDMFFGAANTEKKTYNLSGATGDGFLDEDDFDSSRRSVSSRSTQEWLEEAKRMVAQSPSRPESPVRLGASSPRFATSQSILSPASLHRRDPLSRSSRRHRSPQGISGEILSKTVKNNRNQSQVPTDESLIESPSTSIQKWFSNILKPQNILNTNPNQPTLSSDPTSAKSTNNQSVPPLPPRQSTARKSRFQNSPYRNQSHPIPTPTNLPTANRTFKNPAPINIAATNSAALLDSQLLSPPKHLVESSHRRSISSATCSVPDSQVLPLKINLVDSAQRRSVSAPSRTVEANLIKSNVNGQLQEADLMNQDLNGFLKDQRNKIKKIMGGEITGKAKIVLSGPTNTTSSMVAAICYAWLLESRMTGDKSREEGNGIDAEMMVPVMNMKRGKMWQQRQAAWLFHNVGLDSNALLFSDEVDLDAFMMTKRMGILVVGQDVLKTNSEVGSGCTVLTDNYCEDAYDLLQTQLLKKLLLAGIILDTQNLNVSAKISTTRDAEAVQLLLVGSAPIYRNTLYDQLTGDQRDINFTEVLHHNYGKPPSESNHNKAQAEHRIPDKKTNHDSDAAKADNSLKDMKNAKSPNSGKPNTPPIKTPTAAKAGDRGKNVSFLAKLFGFGSK